MVELAMLGDANKTGDVLRKKNRGRLSGGMSVG